MTGSILRAATVGFASAVMLLAAPFWVEKPYQQWTQKEVSKLLSDSPWVKSAQVSFDFSAMRGAPGMGGPGGSGTGGSVPGTGGPGAGGPGMGGPGMGGPGGPGMGGPMGGGMPELSATVMWRSALPIRQAMYQAAVLQESPAAASLERALAEEPAFHILAVSGLPNGGGPGGMRGPGMPGPGMQGPGGAMPPGANRPAMTEEQRQEMRKQMEERMLANTKLTIGKDVVSAERMETVQAGEQRILLFYFPKNRNLEASDKEAAFETQMGPLKIAATFKPKEMIFAAKPKS